MKNKTFPTKDEAINKGFSMAEAGVQISPLSSVNALTDIYYKGWMDCFEWIKKKTKQRKRKSRPTITHTSTEPRIP